jgi:hypothetical protein
MLHAFRNASVLLATCTLAAYGGFVGADALIHSHGSDRTRASLPNGATLEAVFVGASTCEASRSSALPRAVRGALALLRDSAAAVGVQFASIGLALDWGPSEGIRWLGRVAHFDEVVAGRSWANLGAIDYLWRDSLGVPAMPQLIVATRTILSDRTRVRATRPQAILRLIGAGAIRDWVAEHATRSDSGRTERATK